MGAFFLNKDVEWILDKLESSGYRADIVGGPVRDLIRGAVPSDFDITTSADPEATKSVFAGEHIIETGIKHGTVSLMLHGEQYEITTYRIDGKYEDSRHPTSVSFTENIELDLARRDFTVNAIAYSPRRGITDPFGGREDIERRIIRAVGRAEERFTEDALRIMRAMRFSSSLGFEIEKSTADAMHKCAHLLSNISKERIFTEWKKLLAGERPLEILREFADIVKLIFPELQIDMLLAEIDRSAFLSASPEARHISLFSHASPEEYSAAMHRLKTDRRMIDLGKSVLKAFGKYSNKDTEKAPASPKSDIEIKYLLRDLGGECTRIYLECELILGIGTIENLVKLRKIEESGTPYTLSQLEIDGSDLISLGYRGAQIGEALNMLLSEVIEEKTENKKEVLISHLEKTRK